MKKELWKNNLKELRLKHGLTQQQVAELIGHKSNDRISHWEKGQMVPNFKNIVKLSHLYNISVEKLIAINIGK